MEIEKSNNQFFRFEDLRLYHKAIDYACWVHSNTELFPDSEKNGLSAKFMNAAQSIAINIAEGSARNKPQFIIFLKMAKTSIRECLVISSICQKLNFLSEMSVEESKNTLIELTRMIGALINSLQRCERPNERVRDDDDYNADIDLSV